MAEEPGGGARPEILGWVPKLGVWAWSFVGFVVATVIVVTALAAVSEIVLPLTFAAVLAIVFKPLVGSLERHRLRPALAAGLIVLGLLALMALVVVATVRGVTEQTDQIGAAVDAALDKAADQTDAVGIDQASLDQARAAAEEAAPMVTGGVLTQLVSGIGKLIGLASGLILGALIMYYLLKDGTRLRRSVVAQVDPRLADELDDFISDAIRTLRDYGRGRTVMSVIVSAVIGLVALLLGLPLVFTHHGGELRRRLHPLHRRLPRRRAGRDRRPGRRRARHGRGHAGGRCSPPTCCWRTSSSPRSWAAPWTSTRWWCWS